MSTPNVQIPSLAAAMGAERCPLPACGEAKRKGHPFCLSHYTALPLPRRWGLNDPARAEQAFTAAFKFLNGLTAPLKTTFLENGEQRIPWRYHSHADLKLAGYRYIDHGQCASIRCNKTVWWYWTPNNARMAIDPVTVKPHQAVCADPGYRKRVEEYRAAKKAKKLEARRRKRALLQASARRRR